VKWGPDELEDDALGFLVGDGVGVGAAVASGVGVVVGELFGG